MELSLRSRGNLGRWFGYLVLAFFAIISLFPIWIAVKTALSDSKTLFSSASSFLPQDPTLFNLQRVLGLVNPAGDIVKCCVSETGASLVEMID